MQYSYTDAFCSLPEGEVSSASTNATPDFDISKTLVEQKTLESRFEELIIKRSRLDVIFTVLFCSLLFSEVMIFNPIVGNW